MENERKSLEELLDVMSEAPDSVIDKKISARIKELKGKSIPEMKTEVMHIIDDCVYGALASELGMSVLLTLFEVYLGGTEEDFNDENCPWRKDMI